MSETYMLDDPPTVLEWYDFLCPFCYVGQYRTAILVRQTGTYWEIHLASGSEAGETKVGEVIKAPLDRLGRAALALIGKFPAEEVSSNLHRVQDVMGMGRMSDTSYCVAGKFAQRLNEHELKK